MKPHNIFFIRITRICIFILFTMPLYSNPAGSISLKAPSDKLTIYSEKIQFRWEWKSSEMLVQTLQKYEIHFWAKTGRFENIYTIPSENSNIGDVTFQIDSCRAVFRRHGRYFWKVTAFFNDGSQVVSRSRSFYIGIPELLGKLSSDPFVYALQFDYNHRRRTPGYQAFLKTVNPNSHLRSYSDLRIIFRQSNLGIPTLELEENFIILSQIGLGLDVNTRFRLLRTTYFSLYPLGGAGANWSSTGIQDFSTSLYHTFVGGAVAFMPRGFLTFRACWIPHYHIRYSHVEDDLRTFQGEGWEAGIQIVISQNILKPFRFLGMEIDFERIPISFSISQIEDSYTGTKLSMRKLGLRYVLQ